jgi:hypothetical protein
MKLSDAIVLGSTEINFKPHYWMCEDGGCLLGMGGYAAGVRYTPLEKRGSFSDEIEQITALWPWLATFFEMPQWLRDLPAHGLPYYFNQHDPARFWRAKVIISIMACHIKEGHMTMEQAINWIRENEPKEEVVQPEIKTEEVEVCA